MSPHSIDKSDGGCTVQQNSQAAFREAMSRIGAAVNIVTTDGKGGRTGFAATAVCSVTDNPPTLLICLNKSASVHQAVTQNKVLCVNTLEAGHEELSRRFGGKTAQDERFAGATWRQTGSGALALEDALVSVDCKIEDVVERGSHDVLFCRVLDVKIRDGGKALIYLNRNYHHV
ncbi:FMN reductase [Agrobacterium tumefaciens]|uniref:flavin reductase n=1 Tax=Agrobacterium tumefaciens TaxID=358 RepID=UPI00080FEBCC|nr:FMN reductase [Agrobacterium tumefaciens]